MTCSCHNHLLTDINTKRAWFKCLKLSCMIIMMSSLDVYLKISHQSWSMIIAFSSWRPRCHRSEEL
jgi:hypothetical protein